MTNDLPPLPEYADAFRPRWAGDQGGFTADQMRDYARAALATNVPADPCLVLWKAMNQAGKVGNCTDDKLIVKFLREAGYCIATIAPEATKPCLIEGKCKHGNWCSEVYCQEHCKFVKEEAPAQAQQSLTHELQQQCSDWGVYWRAPDAHGVDLSMEQAEELLRRALLVEVAIAQAKPEAQQPLTWEQFVAACEAEYGEDFAPEEFMGASDDEKTEIMRVARMVERICAKAWGVKLAGIGASGASGEASK